jgi:tellurite resistance protein
MFDLGRLAAALLTGGRGGRSAEARVVRAVTKAVTGEPPRRTGSSAEAARRRREAEASGLPAPRPRRRTTSTERAIATGAAVLAETIAERMMRGPAPTTAPSRPAPATRPPSAPAPPSASVPPLPAPPAGRPATPPPARPPAPPSPEPAARPPASDGLLLVRAMVAAAKADGRLDAAERKAILERLEIAGLTPAERDIVLADFDRPASAEALGKGVKDPMLAARVYAAAAAAAGERCDAEQAFLAALAKALRLDAPAVAAIERQLAG